MAVFKCAGRLHFDDDGNPACEYEASRRWLGRCPRCGWWYRADKVGSDVRAKKERATLATLQQTKLPPRIATCIAEVDKVLNGGIPEGNTVIISGPAGVGKSTLLLMISEAAATLGKRKVCYYAGEQNQDDLAGYAQRLGAKSDRVAIYATQQAIDIYEALETVEGEKADLLIIDSLQVTFCPDSKSDAGSVEQGKVVVNYLTEWAKKNKVAVLLVSHVNKEGELAGAHTVEHLIDGTLEFDYAFEMHSDGSIKEKTKDWRRLTSGPKFRLGPSHATAMFCMGADGIKPVKTKSNLLQFPSRDED